MPEEWFILDSGAGVPAENMAWDEALLLACERLGKPVVRFYGWIEPAATFGYSQHYAEVESWTRLRPLIRRPTGGGLVPHEADWTYSIIFAPSHGWFKLRAQQSYQRLHEWIRDAFVRLRVAAELASEPAKELPGRCFAGPERHDLLWRGAKIAGAAQRRTKQGLLIQGSIQPIPPGVPRKNWQTAMKEVAAERMDVIWRSLPVDASLRENVRELVEQKYSQESFNRRR